MYNLHEPCVLAILKGLAHARLVLTPVDGKGCRDCNFFNNQIFPDSGPKIRKCFPSRVATAKHKWHCCHTTSFCLQLFVVTVGDIPTILGFFFLNSNHKFCNISVFFVLRSIAAPKHRFDLHKIATAQVLLLADASPEVLPNPQCPKVS